MSSVNTPFRKTMFESVARKPVSGVEKINYSHLKKDARKQKLQISFSSLNYSFSVCEASLVVRRDDVLLAVHVPECLGSS